MDDGLHLFGVVDGLDGVLVVADEVVVELDAPGLLPVNHDLTDVKEETIDLRVVGPEAGRAIDGAG